MGTADETEDDIEVIDLQNPLSSPSVSTRSAWLES